MRWEKKGKVCDCNSFNLDWYKKNTMTPLPYKKGNGIIRIYLTMCDADNQGRVGYIDVNASNPSEIISYSRKPVLDLGEKGCFDENGVLPTSLIEENGKLWLYYSAYQRQKSFPYTIFTGLAVSDDGGESFKRVYKVPILDRIDDEMFQRSAAEVMKIGETYRLWYSCGSGWKYRGDKDVPCYDIHCLDSQSLSVWRGKSKQCFELKEDEYGLTMPQVFRIGETYKMIYSVRTFSKGYRMGYAESSDGIVFYRKDEEMKIDVSKEGFDSDMVCFGKCYESNGIIYMLYCGNHYGIGGLGWAELVEV